MRGAKNTVRRTIYTYYMVMSEYRNELYDYSAV